MFTIDFTHQTEPLHQTSSHQIQHLLTFPKQQQSIQQHTHLSITFLHKHQIQHINHIYPHKHKLTHLISFPLQQHQPQITRLHIPPLLPHIIISTHLPQQQPTQYPHSFQTQLAFLPLHR
ncbi:rRNA maturation RNase YbeY, partial [Staphylococcus auricularis]|uniref:rRNA maturation RNase YbeY n=1 Tax=Staphylococcus auricularis TaxID=29379 RepID=UPI001248EDA1